MFYLLARMEADGRDNMQGSWVGNAWFRFEGKDTMSRYILALYFSVSAFVGLGDGDLYETTPTEALFLILYLSYNVVALAYVLGTITMMLVKGDKRVKRFREEVVTLLGFADMNDVPEGLQGSMREYLELQFNSEQPSDEQVLSAYPVALRRKVVRHLYAPALQQCYLFRGTSAMFLDAVMSASRVELFMPKVHILTEGDVMVEMFVVVEGKVQLTRAGAGPPPKLLPTTTVDSSQPSTEDLSQHSGMSFTGSSRMSGNFTSSMGSMGSTGSMSSKLGAHVLGQSDCFGDVGFFADISSPETVVSMTVVRVLIFPRQAYDSLVDTFPEQMRIMMDNLLHKAENDMRFELLCAQDRAQLSEEQVELVSQYTTGNLSPDDMPPDLMAEVKRMLTSAQVQMLETLSLVKSVVLDFAEKVDKLRVYAYLNSAAAGNLVAIKDMIDKGLPVDSMDYDKRTGLMLACHEGHTRVVRYLLEKGADASLVDNFGNTAMFEAVREGKDECVHIMREFTAELGVAGITLAAQLCNCMYERNYEKLRRILRAGADPNAADYDERCALHISAAEGDLEGVRIMVEEGGAKVDLADRWGHTGLSEARRVAAHQVEDYLQPLMQLAGKAPTFAQLRLTAPAKLLAAGVQPKYLAAARA
ncbi:hypothetical protein QJQ45_010984 [Haematococcus lacustris]|nr:hypothetical protein QJQ45_010984 [Haematococcus lacustris]